jgi:hypothetical protein
MADYYSLISTAVSNLPSKTDKARWELYDRACNALQERLLVLDPPTSGDELANERLALETAICKVEEDLLLDIMRQFVSKDAPHPAPSVILSTITEFVSPIEDKLRNAITIVRERLRSGEAAKLVLAIKEVVTAHLAQGLVFVQRTKLKTRNVGRRIYLSIFAEKR